MQRLTGGCQLPIDEQFRGMDRSPLHGEAECSRRKGSIEDARAIDRDLRLVLSVHSVEVRRQVILELHSNDDPEEPRDLRHRATVRRQPRQTLTAAASDADRFAGPTHSLLELLVAALEARPVGQVDGPPRREWSATVRNDGSAASHDRVSFPVEDRIDLQFSSERLDVLPEGREVDVGPPFKF